HPAPPPRPLLPREPARAGMGPRTLGPGRVAAARSRSGPGGNRSGGAASGARWYPRRTASSRRPRLPILGVINQKGGVGKTTTAVNLAAALAERRRVLIVDLDPQANATSGVGVVEPETTIYDVLSGQVSARHAVMPTGVENLDVLAASDDLAGAAVELDASRDNLTLLARSLIGVRPTYDFIVIDAPPSVGALTLNALGAADQLVVPLQTETYALARS